jgi:prevent-host-death family protein
MKVITATEANRSFSKLLAEAAGGKTIGISVRGKVVARIVAEPQQIDAERRKQLHIERLRSQLPIKATRGSRDELYD